MRYFIFLISCNILFSSCFTVNTIKKARLDRKKELVDTVLSSRKDDDGTIYLSFKKKNDNTIYGLAVPLDSVISRYEKEKSIEYVNEDKNSNLIGVFFLENVNGEKGFQRLILFEKAEKTDPAAMKVCNSTGRPVSFKKINKAIPIPVKLVDSTVVYEPYVVKTKPMGFILSNDDPGDSLAAKQKSYVIAIMPHRKKYTRYLLTPFTVAADIVTLPFQVIGYGTMLVITKEIKF